MIAVCLTTFLVSTASAFLPVTPVEPYLIAAAATTGDPAWILGITAGLGQAAGKLVIFLAARGALRSAWLQRRLARSAHQDRFRNQSRTAVPQGTTRRWVNAARTRLDHPRHLTLALFASAVTGLPPLLITSIYAARTKMSLVVFGITCLAGRAIRFSAVASAPHLLAVLHLPS